MTEYMIEKNYIVPIVDNLKRLHYLLQQSCFSKIEVHLVWPSFQLMKITSVWKISLEFTPSIYQIKDHLTP